MQVIFRVFKRHVAYDNLKLNLTFLPKLDSFVLSLNLESFDARRLITLGHRF